MTATGPRVARVVIARGPCPGTDRIEVRTQDGLAGFGEGYWGERGLRRAPEILLGRSPFEAEAIYDELAAADPDTPGGLDMALWDLMGKALGTASAALLGKTFRARVVACAAVRGAGPPDGYRMWRLEPETAEAVEGGFTCGIRLTAATVDEALAMGAHLETRPLAFWESPLAEDDVDGYRRLRHALAIPIAARGVRGLDALLRTLVQHRLVDVVVPEIARFGLTGIRRLAYYCWLFRVRGAVECSGSAVSTAAALAAAALYVPVTNAIAAPAPFVVMPVEAEAAAGLDAAGTLAVSAGPGLGIGEPPPLTAADVILGE